MAKTHDEAAPATKRREDLPGFSGSSAEHSSLWNAFSETPGVGVSLTDVEGRLLFVNRTALELFEGHTDVAYEGKTIADFHPPEFVAERLPLLKRVIESQKPLILRHVYLGRCLESTLWPMLDRKPPFNRVIVVSRHVSGETHEMNCGIDTIDSKYIELGQLHVLTRRELEVFVMLGHGMSIPRIAKTLHRSPKTLERHKAAIAKKLSVRSHAEMARIVCLLGLQFDDAKRTRLTNSPIAKAAPELTV